MSSSAVRLADLASSRALSRCGVDGDDFSLSGVDGLDLSIMGVVGADFSDTIISKIVGGSSSGISSMVLCLVILPVGSHRKAFITDESTMSSFVSLVLIVSLLFGLVSFVIVDPPLSGRPDFFFDFEAVLRDTELLEVAKGVRSSVSVRAVSSKAEDFFDFLAIEIFCWKVNHERKKRLKWEYQIER